MALRLLSEERNKKLTVAEVLRKAMELRTQIYGGEKVNAESMMIQLGNVLATLKSPNSYEKGSALRTRLGILVMMSILWCNDLKCDPEKCIENGFDFYKKILNKG